MDQRQEHGHAASNKSGVTSSRSGSDIQSFPRSDEDSGINPPTFKCKHCDFVAKTKVDYWRHAKIHIVPEKLFTCTQCPFVTQYKYHLQYHLATHSGLKPFKCDRCEYTCVNRTMLNSHIKSHSNDSQYRCKNCNYPARSWRFLKMHHRNCSHNPRTPLYPDRTPNLYPVIDVNSNKRGPTAKSVENNSYNLQQNIQNCFMHFMLGVTPQLPSPFLRNFVNNSFLFNPNFFQIAQHEKEKELKVDEENPRSPQTSKPNYTSTIDDVLDLDERESPTAEQPIRHRRKSTSHKLYLVNQKLDDEDTEKENKDQNTRLNQISNDPSPDIPNGEKLETDEAANTTINIRDSTCQYCDLKFGDEVFYTIHMGHHGFEEPFTCNKCGERCVNKIAFFWHVALTPHS